MRAFRLIGALALLGMTGAGASAATPANMAKWAVAYPPVPVSGLAPAKAAEVRKGEYLVKLSDCMACHTEHGEGKTGKPFAGGLPMKTPFGTIYSPNITPDKATGIGGWTFKQFDQAVRYGKSPRGYLFAAMPYNYYNVMSRKQVRAMWAYLQRVPAVHRKDKAVDMPPPFSWRWLQFGWRFAFFKPSQDTFHYDPDHSAEWNRGRFIVQGPEHCGDCHTPHNVLGGPARRYFLQGSAISGMWAPNVSALAAGPHSVKTITRVFREAKGLGGGTLKGPMLDAIANSMRYMKPSDMRAVAVYIKSVESQAHPSAEPVAMSDVDVSLGRKTYKADCAACHSTGVGGAPKVGDAGDWAALEKAPLFVLYENVWNGVSLMQPKGGCKDCSPRAITSAVVYMLHQSRPGAAGSAPSAAQMQGGGSGGIPKNTVSLAVGKQVYSAHCSACHAQGVAGAPRYGDKSQWASRLKLGLDKLHHNALNGIGAMPPKGGCTSCTRDQIFSAVDYIVSGSGGKAMVQKSLKQKH